MNCEPRIRSASETNPGVVCCNAPLVEHRCPKCQAHAANALRTNVSQEDADVKKDYAPPDSYAPHLTKLRAATASPESTFEERYKAERRKEFGL